MRPYNDVQDITRLTANPDMVRGLPSVFEKFLKWFLQKDPEINITDALQYFARLSNPNALHRVCVVYI